MNRLLTTIVQLSIAIPALYMARMMWRELKEDVRELTKDLR
jgi:biopolymer transport protein ExbB/TolQ